jgi:hypothetical protein
MSISAAAITLTDTVVAVLGPALLAVKVKYVTTLGVALLTVLVFQHWPERARVLP